LKWKKFHLNLGINVFAVRVIKHWKQFPREAVDSPSMEIFRTGVDMALGSLPPFTMF